MNLSGPLKQRLRASGIHVAVSACLVGLLVVVVTGVWYPTPLFSLAKGRDIFFILAGCDVTLGPLMTLVIFNVRKPKTELIRDVTIIAVVQLIALVYGAKTLFEARPAYIVYNVGEFNVPLVSEMVGDGSTNSPYSLNPLFGPKLVGAVLPEGVQERNSLTFSAVSGQGDVYQMPKYFVTYNAVRDDVKARSVNAETLAKQIQRSVTGLKSIESKYLGKGFSVGLLPLRVRTTLAAAVVDRKTGDLLAIEPIPDL